MIFWRFNLVICSQSQAVLSPLFHPPYVKRAVILNDISAAAALTPCLLTIRTPRLALMHIHFTRTTKRERAHFMSIFPADFSKIYILYSITAEHKIRPNKKSSAISIT